MALPEAKMATPEALSSLVDDLARSGLQLRQYQLDGVAFLLRCRRARHGALLADEMGLGKTCQAVCTVVCLRSEESPQSPALVICPLSVADSWMQEIARFGLGLRALLYRGDAAERDGLRGNIATGGVDIVVTTYEVCLMDVDWFTERQWSHLIVDEAHRLKNSKSQIHGTIESLQRHWTLLLTGTPVHNNLAELHTLLVLVAPGMFPPSADVSAIEGSDPALSSLRRRMAEVMLRRTKGQVCAELPERTDALIYADLSPMQRNMYKAILAKDHSLFDQVSGSGTRQNMLNTLAQLRKCVNHPYLFSGVEPEPFAEGEHLVTASGKLFVLDRLLAYLHQRRHRVLLFSQSTMMLDILQDYVTLRRYSYERLDGSVRSEERFAAVRSFNKNTSKEQGPFVFLLSTRAGGLGLTLTAADTVIFYDSDFNPQVDLQAAARAHRIGQTKPVRTIRLVGRHTVDEVIAARAAAKLRLCESIIDTDDSTRVTEIGSMGQELLKRLLLSGLGALQAADCGDQPHSDEQQSGDLDDVFTKQLGDTDDNGCWLPVQADQTESSDTLPAATSSIYYFDGRDYKNVDGATQTAEYETDLKALEGIAAQLPRPKDQGLPAPLQQRNKLELTEEEKVERKRKAAELALERQRRRAERTATYWEENNYTSTNLPEPPEDERVEGGDAAAAINFVLGDVTRPECSATDADMLVVHVVDDSGVWGTGGLFDALCSRFEVDVIPDAYKTAKEMRDLHLGDAHLVFEGRPTCVVLSVAQSAKKRDTIDYKALERSLRRVAHWALRRGRPVSVHVPRIGYRMANVQWYSVERLLRKHLCDRGLPLYVYYFDRKNGRKTDAEPPAKKVKNGDVSPRDSPSSNYEPRSSHTNETEAPSKANASKATLFEHTRLYLHGIDPTNAHARRLSRLAAAFGAEIVQSLEEATHVMVANDTSKGGPPNVSVPVVRLDWVEQCLKQSRLLHVEDYGLV